MHGVHELTASTARIRKPEHVLLQEIGDELALLNLNTEKYYALDDVGMRMWAVLMSSESVQQAEEALLDEYEVEPDQLRRDLYELIERLLAHDLVQVAS